MHNNYFVIRRISSELAPILQDAELIECFTQNKTDFVLSFILNNRKEFHLKTFLHPDFSCFEFKDDYQKSDRYSQNLWKEVLGAKVQKVIQADNDRCFWISLSNGYSILFKMYGSRSNVALIQKNEVQKLYNYKLKNDFELNLEQIHRSVDTSFGAFQEGGMQAAFPTLGKELKAYLQIENQDEQSYQKIINVVNGLSDVPFYICNTEKGLQLLLFRRGEVLHEYTSALEAVNCFYRLFVGPYFFEKKKEKMMHEVNVKLKSLRNYYKKTFSSLEKIEASRAQNEIADIIMANLHAIDENLLKLELFDFYTNEQIEITLKKNTTPQKYAEQLYRKAKNKKIEVAKLEENIAVAEDKINRLETVLAELERVDNAKGLRSIEKKYFSKAATIEEEQQALFKTVEYKGFTILIGRNAGNNDEIVKTAKKEDLWLHAKGVQGSHVLVRAMQGAKFPIDVIEKAASIAAFYSKRKTDTLCPVIYTPRKFVRKVKGAAKGAVMVDREQVVLIEPQKE